MPLGIIVDTALERRAKDGNPVRLAMIGSGFMANGIVRTLTTAHKGSIKLVGICNRNIQRARTTLEDPAVAGMSPDAMTECQTAEEIQAAYEAGKVVLTSNWADFVSWEAPEVVLEVTGTIEYASHIVVAALRAKKHVVAMNAEMDATLGPLLKRIADENGVVYSNSDGDQPGVILNLWRYVKSIGFKPMVAGNIKGFHNIYGNPTTQKGFADQTKQNPYMVASFCDGSKVSFEQVVVANATGMKVPQRGMYGKTLRAPVEEAPSLYDIDELLAKGPIVDYVVGLRPAAGVYVLGYNDDPLQKHYMSYYKQGNGPLYTFYTPYHLCHVEVPISCARAVLFQDAVCAPIGPPVGDVLSVAKKDMKAGEVLDSIGGYTCYGIAECAIITRAEGLLPLGLAEGCVLLRDVAQDTVITWADVAVPAGRYCDALWKEQNEAFGLQHPEVIVAGEGGKPAPSPAQSVHILASSAAATPVAV